jgi:hypothetical protein
MFIQVLGLFVLAYSIIGITIGTISAYDTRVAIHLQSNLVRGTMERAKAQLLLQVAQNTENGTTTAPTFTPGDVCPGAGNTTPDGKPCPYVESATYTFSGSTTAGNTGQGTSVTADNVNTAINESRQSYQIVATVSEGANGAIVSSRTGFITLRTYAAAPYADIAGFVDGTANVARQTQEGDTSGCDPSLMTACDAYGTTQPVADAQNDPTGGDTRLNATSQCQSSANFTCTTPASPEPINSYSTAVYRNANSGGQ